MSQASAEHFSHQPPELPWPPQNVAKATNIDALVPGFAGPSNLRAVWKNLLQRELCDSKTVDVLVPTKARASTNVTVEQPKQATTAYQSNCIVFQ